MTEDEKQVLVNNTFAGEEEQTTPISYDSLLEKVGGFGRY